MLLTKSDVEAIKSIGETKENLARTIDALMSICKNEELVKMAGERIEQGLDLLSKAIRENKTIMKGVSMKEDEIFIDIAVELHHETDLAWLVSDDGDRDSAKWVPKSKCTLEAASDGSYVLVIPEWLAEEKEFF